MDELPDLVERISRPKKAAEIIRALKNLEAVVQKISNRPSLATPNQISAIQTLADSTFEALAAFGYGSRWTIAFSLLTDSQQAGFKDFGMIVTTDGNLVEGREVALAISGWAYPQEPNLGCSFWTPLHIPIRTFAVHDATTIEIHKDNLGWWRKGIALRVEELSPTSRVTPENRHYRDVKNDGPKEKGAGGRPQNATTLEIRRLSEEVVDRYLKEFRDDGLSEEDARSKAAKLLTPSTIAKQFGPRSEELAALSPDALRKGIERSPAYKQLQKDANGIT